MGHLAGYGDAFMKIQWMLFARAYRENRDGTLSIAGIFDGVTVEGPPFHVPMQALAAVRFQPQEAGIETQVTLSIDNVEGGNRLRRDLPYVYPTLREWLEGARAYISFDLTGVEYAEVGEYSVSLLHDGQMVACESFNLRAVQGG